MSSNSQIISSSEAEIGFNDTLLDAEELEPEIVVPKKRISKEYDLHGVYSSLEEAQKEFAVSEHNSEGLYNFL